jgi:hypothetical protein
LVEEGTPRGVVVCSPGAEGVEATVTSWRPEAVSPPVRVIDEPSFADARTSMLRRVCPTSRAIAGLTVAAAIVIVVPPELCPRGIEPPPAALPGIPEPKTTSREPVSCPPGLESSAKIGSPIVNHIRVTSGSASATGAKRVRRSSTARGAGSRRGPSM